MPVEERRIGCAIEITRVNPLSLKVRVNVFSVKLRNRPAIHGPADHRIIAVAMRVRNSVTGDVHVRVQVCRGARDDRIDSAGVRRQTAHKRVRAGHWSKYSFNRWPAMVRNCGAHRIEDVAPDKIHLLARMKPVVADIEVASQSVKASAPGISES